MLGRWSCTTHGQLCCPTRPAELHCAVHVSYVNNNQLTTLPDGLFDGLGSLGLLYVVWWGCTVIVS